MGEGSWYLKEDVYFEPLFNQWYAWPYLLPPATAARHAVNTHQRIMRSFVNNHHLHILATQEKGLEGGDYLDVGEAGLPEIKKLLEDFDVQSEELILLNEALKQLDSVLREHKNGESLLPLYAKVPEPLRGRVELVYDLEHNPSYRLIEPLLYRSKYYKPELQTLSLGMLNKVKNRPFVLSTPRLPDENHIQIGADFNHSVVDALFSAREIPIDTAVRDQLFNDLETKGGLDVAELFSSNPPKLSHQPVEEGVVRLSYTGHAGFLLETSDVAIVIDPVIASRSENAELETISFGELPSRIDYACLTHNHQDHVNIETLLQLRYKIDKALVPKNNGGSLADPSIRLMLRHLNINADEVDELDRVDIPGGFIVAIPFLGEHGDLNVRSKTAWFVQVLGRRFYFGADSSNPDSELFSQLSEEFGDLDVLAIGMECVGAPYTWLYGALHSKMVSKNIKNSRRLNGSDSQQALKMLDALGSKQVLIYALGLEPCYRYFMGLDYDDDSKQLSESRAAVAECEARGIPAEALSGRRSFEFTTK